jgi:LSD1 subclass zinc finger protein
MISRSMTATMSGRAAAARRLRRRAVSSTGRLYCTTNGCTTFMIVEEGSDIVRCPVCQAVRRLR